MITQRVESNRYHQMIPVTHMIQNAVREQGWQDGILNVFIPHTTAGVTINENADPDVASDMSVFWEKLVPQRPEFQHAEGNTPSHILASLVGSSLQIIVSKGALVLGTWQGVYFCDFDGPRQRKMLLAFQ